MQWVVSLSSTHRHSKGCFVHCWEKIHRINTNNQCAWQSLLSSKTSGPPKNTANLAQNSTRTVLYFPLHHKTYWLEGQAFIKLIIFTTSLRTFLNKKLTFLAHGSASSLAQSASTSVTLVKAPACQILQVLHGLTLLTPASDAAYSSNARLLCLWGLCWGSSPSSPWMPAKSWYLLRSWLEPLLPR